MHTYEIKVTGGRLTGVILKVKLFGYYAPGTILEWNGCEIKIQRRLN